MDVQTTDNGTTFAGDLIFLILFAVAYLAPTILAAVRRNTNLVWVAVVDIVLAWTFVGWIVAWVLVFTGSRRGQQPYPMYAAPWFDYTRTGLSPDGLYWWDGTAWRSTAVSAPPHATRSPDGRWWWDGLNWRLVPNPPEPPAP